MSTLGLLKGKMMHTGLLRCSCVLVALAVLSHSLSAQTAPFGTNVYTTGQTADDPVAAIEEAGGNPNMACQNVSGEFDLPCPESSDDDSANPCTTCQGSAGDWTVMPFPQIARSAVNMPVAPTSFFTYGQSIVDNLTLNYIHDADDLRRTPGSSLFLRRYFRSRQFHKSGSLGPGCFTNFDLRLEVEFNRVMAGGFKMQTADLFDPASVNEIRFTSSAANTDLRPSYIARAKSLEFLDGSKNAMDTSSSNGSNGQISMPTYARLNSWNGDWFLFELINVEVGPSGSGWSTPTDGRLIEAKTAHNTGYTISYKTWTNTQLDASPSRQWQMDTITDVTGLTMDVEYNSTQQAGEWVISRVEFPDGGDVNYTYGGEFLATAVHEDGSTTTITYLGSPAGTSSSNLAEIVIDDPVAAGGHRRKSVAMSGSVATVGGVVVPTSVGLTRAVRNGAGELSYFNSGASQIIYEGGGKMREVIEFAATWGPGGYYNDGWSLSFSTGEPIITGSVESSEEEFVSANKDIWSGIVESHRSPDGVYREFLYDANGSVTFTFHEDDTFEAYCYDSNCNKVSRYRDREGNVTKYVYDSAGRQTQMQVGLTDGPSNQGTPDSYSGSGYNRCPTDDVQTAEYAVRYRTYYTSGSGEGQLATTKDELGNVTDYEYNTAGQLYKIKEPADTSGGARAETTMTYQYGRLKTIADPDGNVTEHYYDSMGRRIKTIYADSSQEERIYGTTGNSAGLVAKSIDRGGIVTSFAYDAADRMTTQKTATAVKVGSTETSTPTIELEETRTYVDGSSMLAERTVAGALTKYKYDYRGRMIEQTSYPRAGKTLVQKSTYVDNRLFSREDPYGRKKYYAYDATDGRLIRTIIGAVSTYTLANQAAVLSAVRNTSANANFVVSDTVFTAGGSVEKQINAINTETRYAYDSRDRQTEQKKAFGASIEAKTQTDYDLASNTTEIRSPRYFDSGDTEGYQNTKETWTYNGRNRVKTHVVAPGTSVAATESFTYDLKGRLATHTDFAAKVWTTNYDSCCDKSLANENPLGHGSIRNTNSRGLVVHTATVSDVDDHLLDMTSPVNAKTLGESTTKYDGRGRPEASTTWLTVRGAIDVESPPIAGLNSVAAADGLTTQYLYDDNLADGSGLDASGGVSFTKTASSGTSSVSLANAITKLSGMVANGGAGITFNGTAPGRAVVSVNAEDEVSFSISDAAGRTVMSGQLDSSNALLTWSCQLHDTLTNVSGFGGCLETQSIDAIGNVTKTLTDAAGRTLRTVDQLGKVTSFTYDSDGNPLSVRDPNSVGQNVVYDALGRAGLTTDTAGDTTNSTYDKAGNRVAAIDGKSKSTTYTYDARGRQKSQKDRINGTTSFTYLATGQLTSLTDSESQTTSYTFDNAGQKLTTQHPDHTGGSSGTSTYGIVTFTNDAAGRVLRKQDQLGDTVTYNYDLAGRLTKRDYRNKANSPFGSIADSDTFTYDKVGRMFSAINGRYTNTVGYAYDDAGRKSSESLTISGKTYTIATSYNTLGQLTSFTYPDGTSVQRTHTARGELHQLKHAGTTIATRTYDNGGRMTGCSYNNGVSESRGYNSDNTLAAVSYSGASLGNHSYSWDSNKNNTGETITGIMSNYGFSTPANGYDNEDRLVGYNRTSGLNQSWSLSTVGDWNSVATNGTSQARTHGAAHELTTVAANSVTTDVKGNMDLIPSAARPDATALALTWDFDNRLKSADHGNNGSVEVTYQFDAFGRRVARTANGTTTVYVQSDQQTIADYTAGANSSSPLYRYIYASYVDEPVLRYQPSGAQSVYYHRNQQYSVTALTNASGGIVERYAYTAYGTPTITNASGTVLASSAQNNRYTYTGREWDETLSLYHYRARTYDAALGRFCSKDPIGYRGMQWSLFNLGRNAPFKYLDPSGLMSTFPRRGSGLGGTLGVVPTMPVVHWHHIFPDSLGPLFSDRCPGLDVDEWTTPIEGPYSRGTEHYLWHHDCTSPENYIDTIQDILANTDNCCDLMREVVELVQNTHACVRGLMGNETIGPIYIGTRDGGLKGIFDGQNLIDWACEPDCLPERGPRLAPLPRNVPVPRTKPEPIPFNPFGPLPPEYILPVAPEPEGPPVLIGYPPILGPVPSVAPRLIPAILPKILPYLR